MAAFYPLTVLPTLYHSLHCADMVIDHRSDTWFFNAWSTPSVLIKADGEYLITATGNETMPSMREAWNCLNSYSRN
jgi:hypothetical protein